MGKNHPNVDPYVVSRVRALESVLTEKGYIDPAALDVLRAFCDKHGEFTEIDSSRPGARPRTAGPGRCSFIRSST